MRRRDTVAQTRLKKASKDKERWASRGPEEIRRSQDLNNAARRRASLQSLINQNEASMYQPPPAPNITTSSSSSSSSSASTTAFVDNEERIMEFLSDDTMYLFTTNADNNTHNMNQI